MFEVTWSYFIAVLSFAIWLIQMNPIDMGSSAQIVDCVLLLLFFAIIVAAERNAYSKRIELEHLWMIRVVVTDDDSLFCTLLFFNHNFHFFFVVVALLLFS